MRGDAGDLLGEIDGDAVLRVHVQPRSGRREVTGRHGDALRVRVTAPPVDGRATDEARRLVAEALGLRPAAVSLLSGAASRVKRYRLAGLDRAAALARVDRLLESG